MKIALLGATGRTGAHVLTTALDHDHDVTVLVAETGEAAGEGHDSVRRVSIGGAPNLDLAAAPASDRRRGRRRVRVGSHW